MHLMGSTEGSVEEQRPLEPVREIVLRGAVDVVFRRAAEPQLLVTGEGAAAVRAVKTYVAQEVLILERRRVAAESAPVKRREGVTVTHYDRVIGDMSFDDLLSGPQRNGLSAKRDAVVHIGLPQMPKLSIEGRSIVRLFDLDQPEWVLKITGWANVAASGRVHTLTVDARGIARVNVGRLVVQDACLSIAGSGQIKAFVQSKLKARSGGVGDIVVRGNASGTRAQ